MAGRCPLCQMYASRSLRSRDPAEIPHPLPFPLDYPAT